jgi:hypothetical protein
MLFVLAMMAQFQFWDGIMTHVFVNNGIVKEANHLVAPLVAGGDFLLVKLIGIVVLFWLLWTVFKRLHGILCSCPLLCGSYLELCRAVFSRTLAVIRP